MGIVTVLWEKWREFVRDFYKITLAAMIAPLLYLLVFGFGLQMMSHGESYLNYLIPGVVALSSMNGSFGAVAQNLTVQRMYERALDQVMISPTPLWQFIVGQIIAGSLRGIYSGLIIMILVLPVKTGLVFNGFTFLIMFLNGAAFSTIAVVVSFCAKNHTDMPRFSNFVIMPMSFLCNTFFSLDSLPPAASKVLNALPLSQASLMIREIAGGGSASAKGILILLTYVAVFLALAFAFIYRKKNI
ncbi:MAG: ABC transporter permease [Clostridiales bacterium]|nr:ABC transporter permease [Clostridiales bacterium]